MPPEPGDPREYLADMRDSARLAIEYLNDVSFEDYARNSLLQDAVVRRIEVLGEAANRVGQVIRDSMPQIPWHEIRGMRNVLAHQYDDIDHRIIYNVVRNNLPAVINMIDSYLDPTTQPPHTERP